MMALLVAASPIEKRNGATVAADLKDVGVKLDNLTAALEKYQGGIVAGLPVQQAESPLETAITKAATDVKAEPTPIDEAEARQVLQAFQDIEPGIKKSTDAVIAKATAFGSLKSTVKGDMVRMKDSSDALADALIAKAPDAVKKDATDAKAKVDNYFAGAIKSVET
ncbi:Putative uncharacterized protein [Taphrina deformans PYCC 5710]|uniref:Hydrophobic surface binding protein A n=1 Tax=Taphrina deformans (strain PYCC 5710 / ATCC 11124 / CBS 356.35 / IMI 108563 / JCM 9778 / NBRC 8474) TaxID=1097556 RepID=R4XD87_TAPDE|nr:Putative uncharacterized protein [Taphrina deformans PYCC 5710]|eukprot:CCG83558.1 Putative uncharacterized protein [Taphrina deformans PYCC 5710]